MMSYRFCNATSNTLPYLECGIYATILSLISYSEYPPRSSSRTT